MAVEGNEKVYTVDATFYTLFSNDIMAMASRESLPDMQMENVASFKIENDENTIEFQKKADGTWITSENTAADSGLITELFAKILKLRYEQMVVYQPGEEQLAEYGLDIPQTCLLYTARSYLFIGLIMHRYKTSRCIFHTNIFQYLNFAEYLS